MKRYYNQIGLIVAVLAVTLMVGFGGYRLYQYVIVDPVVIDGDEVDNPVFVPGEDDLEENPVNAGIENPKPLVQVEKFAKPFSVDAQVLKPFFDVYQDLSVQVSAVTYFEGVYRPNMGVDFGNDNKAFNVTASASGVVSDVFDDPIFGKSVVITSENGYIITYQSLADVVVSAHNTIKQGDLIGVASENVYNPELNKHLHVSVERNGSFLNFAEILNRSVK